MHATSGEPPPWDLPDWLTSGVRDVRHVGVALGGAQMARGLVVGDLRVQVLERAGGRRSFTIVWPEGAAHEAADAFLRTYDGSGTQRTYAFLLVDHLRWLEREALTLDRAGLRDLRRYMGLLGAKVAGPHGEPWRAGKRPYGRSALSTAAACLKGFYVHQASLGVNRELGDQLAPDPAADPG
jgi:hypothetical protein